MPHVYIYIVFSTIMLVGLVGLFWDPRDHDLRIEMMPKGLKYQIAGRGIEIQARDRLTNVPCALLILNMSFLPTWNCHAISSLYLEG